MKKLLIIPMLLVCFMSYGQTVDSASIIGIAFMEEVAQNVDVNKESFLVAQHNFPNEMTYDDAVNACASLGPGWRLPSKFELTSMYWQREFKGYSEGIYWSSSDVVMNFMTFESRINGLSTIGTIGENCDTYFTSTLPNAKFNVRAVRTYVPPANINIGIAEANPGSIIDKSIKIGNLEVAQHDFPASMNWDDATAACAALGNGWRLPNGDELNILYQNKNEIGGFVADGSYWSSWKDGDDLNRWWQSFENGSQLTANNGVTFYVRAVRSF